MLRLLAAIFSLALVSCSVAEGPPPRTEWVSGGQLEPAVEDASSLVAGSVFAAHQKVNIYIRREKVDRNTCSYWLMQHEFGDTFRPSVVEEAFKILVLDLQENGPMSDTPEELSGLLLLADRVAFQCRGECYVTLDASSKTILHNDCLRWQAR